MNNKPSPDQYTYSPEQLESMLSEMQRASNTFYSMAVRIGCHPFIEFAGLMNEYIKMCVAAKQQGIDFTQTNAHTGQALPMADYNARYLGEKVGCIYGPALAQNAALAHAFLVELALASMPELFTRPELERILEALTESVEASERRPTARDESIEQKIQTVLGHR